MYKFSHRHIAIKLVRTARNLTFDSQKGHGDLEVEVNLLHLLLYFGNNEKFRFTEVILIIQNILNFLFAVSIIIVYLGYLILN